NARFGLTDVATADTILNSLRPNGFTTRSRHRPGHGGRMIGSFKKVAAWARNTFTPTRPIRTKNKPSAPTFRPQLETLDAREVPAVFTWTGASSTDAADPANWQVTGDPPAADLPSENDDVRFIAMSSGFHDCDNLSTFLASPSGAFNSLTL